ncbi:proline dehydrogenase family protein [Natronorarus salvus]|uniref:proline dehydrogenase family protein n=1 Tax=Natronorarus salvus TaxID=3117733 RepID=UPI002F268CA5
MIPPIADRFVAGESPATALDHARRWNQKDVNVILNLLGEHYDDSEDAAADTEEYRTLLSDIAAAGLDACISVKPSQIGLDLGTEVFEENLASIVEAADEEGEFVWIDMEDHTTTDATLDAFERFVTERGGGMGVCLQANLRRTKGDVERFADLPGKIRLVKGAYEEPEEIAYTEKERINTAYRELLTTMFETYDDGIAIGSHDPAMVDLGRDLHDRWGTPFEVQMLMGVREDAQISLAREYEVWQYTPYGSRWASYFYRRVMERKGNALFAARAIVGR